MPLIKGKSKRAFSRNVATEMKEGHKPQKQAVAIAYSVMERAMRRKGKRSMVS